MESPLAVEYIIYLCLASVSLTKFLRCSVIYYLKKNVSSCYSRQKPQWYKRRRPFVTICENIRKYLNYKKAKLVSKMWNKETIFVKLFWLHEIFAKICVRQEQLREQLAKLAAFLAKKLIIFVAVWWFSRKWKCFQAFCENETSRIFVQIHEISHFREN